MSPFSFTFFALTQVLYFTGMASVDAAVSSAAALVNPLQQNALLGGVEASVMGESALVDKETGRIFWEGGSSSTLAESVGPKIEQFGILHIKATILSCILLVALAGPLASFLRQKLEESVAPKATHRLLSISVLLINWTILNVPRLNRWFVVLTIMLYLAEAYNCSTRRYLANAINSPTELEAFLDTLREAPPDVEWKVRSFHYEKPLWLSPTTLTRKIKGSLQKQQQGNATSFSDTIESSASMLRRKVVTHQATGSYQYEQCADKTTVGVWKRAPASSSYPAPFTKMILTKLLVLANEKARKDYFKQQSAFVTEHGQGDEFAEFSTSIKVGNFRPKMLAIRPIDGVPFASKLFRSHLFWTFTLLGLTVPYRIWFARHCDELRVTVVKETSAELQVSPSRSWLSFPLRSSAEPTSAADDDQEAFRSLMQQLQLYAEQESSPEQQNATAAVMEEVATASSLVSELTAVIDLNPPNASKGDELLLDGTTIPDTNTTSTNVTAILNDALDLKVDVNATKPEDGTRSDK